MRLNLHPRVMRFAPRLPRAFPYGWVEAALIVLLAIQAARLIYAAVSPLGPIGDWTGPQSTALTPGAGVLIRFDPFFRQSATPGTAVVTSVPLKLFGVRLDQASGRSSAIVALPDGLQSSFAIGDEIMPGIVLKSVAFDSITIDRGGVAEQLFLDQSVAAVVAQPVAGGATPAPMPPISVSALRSGVAFAPRIGAGGITGFTVNPQGGGETFRSVGFQPGDVVTTINGSAVRSLKEVTDALGNAPTLGRITLTVERGGTPITLSPSVNP